MTLKEELKGNTVNYLNNQQNNQHYLKKELKRLIAILNLSKSK